MYARRTGSVGRVLPSVAAEMTAREKMARLASSGAVRAARRRKPTRSLAKLANGLVGGIRRGGRPRPGIEMPILRRRPRSVGQLGQAIRDSGYPAGDLGEDEREGDHAGERERRREPRRQQLNEKHQD